MRKCKACGSKLYWLYREDLGWWQRCPNEQGCPEWLRRRQEQERLLKEGVIALIEGNEWTPVYRKDSIFGKKVLLNPQQKDPITKS